MPRLIFIVILFISYQANALNKLGHQLVCQLSFEQLPIKQQQQITQLLTHIPKQHVTLINQYNYQNKTSEITFAKACTWPDAIKQLDDYKKFNAWHYVNVPRHALASNEAFTKNILSKQTTSNCRFGCLLYGIQYHYQEYQNNENPWQKLQALMFLGHWLGDIHQPLHVSFADDRGGNKSRIKSHLKCNNLHWYWDECLLAAKKEPVNQLYQSLSKLKQHSPMQHAQSSNLQTDIINWAHESLLINQQSNFRYCHINKQPNSKHDKKQCSPYKNRQTINKHYVEYYQPILKERIIKAAARLTALINRQ